MQSRIFTVCYTHRFGRLLLISSITNAHVRHIPTVPLNNSLKTTFLADLRSAVHVSDLEHLSESVEAEFGKSGDQLGGGGENIHTIRSAKKLEPPGEIRSWIFYLYENYAVSFLQQFKSYIYSSKF